MEPEIFITLYISGCAGTKTGEKPVPPNPFEVGFHLSSGFDSSPSKFDPV